MFKMDLKKIGGLVEFEFIKKKARGNFKKNWKTSSMLKNQLVDHLTAN